MMNMTIDQVAKKLNVSTQAAYGLVSFLKERGGLVVKDAPPNGMRGRRPKLYSFTGSILSVLSEIGLDVLVSNSEEVKAA
jgi:predicted ArsR family transcriptional regulator